MNWSLIREARGLNAVGMVPGVIWEDEASPKEAGGVGCLAP